MNLNNSKTGIHIKSENLDPLTPDANFNSAGQSGASGMNITNNNSNRMASQLSPERIQNLPSNVINKQTNSMDVSFIIYRPTFCHTYIYSFSICNSKAKSLYFLRHLLTKALKQSVMDNFQLSLHIIVLNLKRRNFFRYVDSIDNVSLKNCLVSEVSTEN